MDQYFKVQGGRRLSGEVAVRGAKNSGLKILSAGFLFSGELLVENLPKIEDVSRTIEILEDLGVSLKMEEGALKMNADNAGKSDLNPEISKKIRASIVMTGPLLATMGRVSFPHPGGCVIGRRPIDLFFSGWEAMGASVKMTEAGYEVAASELKGAEIVFQNVSVTATETMMMTAVLAKGRTILRNAACEPEIPALADFLNDSGAMIRGAGAHTIEIEGTDGTLLKARKPFRVIPDRIEAGCFLVLGALLGEPLKITSCNPSHLSVPISILRSAGVLVETGSDWIKVGRADKLKSVNIKTREYPGFPTDLQAPFAVFMTQAEGESMIFETVFEGRLGFVEELNRMGAKITVCDPHRIIAHGKTPLNGRDIESPDIRAGLAFLIAALVADGESKVGNIYQIDRGYERIEERLNRLGAAVLRSGGE